MLYTKGVQVRWAEVSLCVVPLLMGLPVWASVTPLANPAVPADRKIIAADQVNDAKTMLESLRRDVARHPGDFIVFPTKAGARQFFLTHRDAVELETDPRIIARGVVGYCQGKMVVVLPWGPLGNF